MTEAEVAKLVQSYLDRSQPEDYRLNVIDGAIELRKEWWYVTVLPDREGVSSYDYSNRLADIEEIMEADGNRGFMLLPVIVDD